MYRKFTQLRSYPLGYIIKFLFAMKLIAFLLIVSSVQVSASAFGQQITLKDSNATYEQVFREIRKQTGYDILVENTRFNTKQRIAVYYENTPLKIMLNHLVKGTDITYTIHENSIVFKERSVIEKITDLFSEEKVMQTQSITGIVTDADSGEPLPGTNLFLEGNERGVATDINGRYRFDGVAPGSYTLVASNLGYIEQKQAIVVKEDEPLSINLELSPDLLEIEEVLVTGYYSLPKERATGSFTHLDAEDLEGITSLSVKDKLEGLVPGLVFLPNYNSDQNPTLDRSSGVIIRGQSTLGDNSPLIVVDGFPVIASEGVDAWSTINPDDVESITVLKDAAAASIWGAQAANGVIVITTKDGSGTSGSTLNVGVEYLTQPTPDLYEIPFASSQESIDLYTYLFQETTYFDALTSSYWRSRLEFPEVIDAFVQMKAGDITEQEGNQRLSRLAQIDVRDEFQELFFRPDRHKKVNLSFSNSNKVNTLRASVMALQSDENAKGNTSQKIIGNLNNRFRPADWVAISFGVNFSLSEDENNGVDIRDLQAIPQMSRILDAEGNYLPMIKNSGDDFYYNGISTTFRSDLVEQYNLPYDWNWNLKRDIDNQDQTLNRNDLRLKAGFEFTPFEGLKADISYQYQNNFALASNYLSPETWYVRNAVNENARPDGSFPVPAGGMLYERRSSFSSHNARFQLSYAKTVEDHSVKVLAGSEIRSDYRESLPYGFYGYDPQSLTQITALNFQDEINPKLHGDDEFRGTIPPIPTLPPNSISIGGRNDRFLSYYGNVGYTYKGRYDITGSIRLDQTNLYGRSASYRELPQWSVGAGYTLSNEPFFNVDFVNYLRFRGAYGFNGHIDKSASPFISGTPWIDPVNQSQYAAVLSTPNPALTWEKTGNLNIGVDFGILNKRIQGLIEIYSKKSTNVLADFEVNPTYGFYYDEATLNQGDINNHGLEIDISALVIDDAVKWETAFNYSHNINKVLNVESVGTNMAARTSMSQFYPVQGQPVDYIAVADFAGYSDEGLLQVMYQGKVQDISEVPYVGADLDDLFSYVGQRSPKHWGSWINNISYKNFKLSARLLYSFGHKFLDDAPPRGTLYNYQRMTTFFTWNPSLVVNRWQSPADNTSASMYGLGTKVANYTATLANDYLAEYNTSNVLDAGQVRLQSISLNYRIPGKFLGAIENASIQLQARNLGPIFLKNDKGIDPSFPRYSGSLYSAYYNVIRDRPEFSVSLRVDL